MPLVMAVSFERYGRLFYLDPGASSFAVGDKVLVPTDSGPEVAECVWAPEWVSDDDGFTDLPACAGAASETDLQRDAANKRKKAEAKLVAKKLIKQLDLPMKVLGVDVVDRPAAEAVIAIYYQAPHRVDFRALVGQLARVLSSKIDLRQVGSRDGARITGGIGNCGRELCCATFLKDFEPVTLRMAKAQDLPVNPMRISGACGRLMCCLKYEHPLYAEFAKNAPKVGERVDTPDGSGVVVGHQVPSDAVLVRMNDSGTTTSCSRAGVCGSRSSYETRKPRHRNRNRADPPDPAP